MKKFITAIPLAKQGMLRPYHYHAPDNVKLQMDTETCFPILTVVNGYAVPGEDFRLIALMTDSEDGNRNCGVLRQELRQMCDEKGLVCSKGVEVISVGTEEGVGAHVNTFQKLLDFLDDDDELFLCMTFGTKPQSQALLTAIRYAYRIKYNVSITCVVYGGIDRTGDAWVPSVYDMTALTQLDEIIRLLADRKAPNPKQYIDRILEL